MFFRLVFRLGRRRRGSGIFKIFYIFRSFGDVGLGVEVMRLDGEFRRFNVGVGV